MNVSIHKDRNIRVDKNLPYHIDKFKRYKEDEYLIKSLILYFSFNFEKNLFGFSTLDPAHFCKVMKHSIQNIKRKHPNPIYYKVIGVTKEDAEKLQEKYGRVSEHRILDSRLENALLILRYEKIVDTYVSKDEFADVISFKDFRFIDDLQVVIKKTGKTHKLMYHYKLNKNFEISLKKFFFNASINHYNILRENNLGDWYLSILSRITSESKKGKSKIFYAIEELGKDMNISTNMLNKKTGFSQLKKRINNKFNNKFLPIVQDDIDQLQLIWKKGEKSKYENIPVIKWRNKTNELANKNDQLIYNDIFYTEYFKDLSIFFYNNYEKLSKHDDRLNESFLKWLLDGIDYDIKISKFLSNYVDILGKHNDVKKIAINFIDKLIMIGRANKVHNFLYYENEHFVFVNKTKSNAIFKYSEMKNLLNELISNFSFFEMNYSKEIRD